MRLRVRDAVAVILFAAVLVPYVGYLVNGDMPLIDNARSMASTGLFLGGAAFWVIRSGRPLQLGRVEGVAAALALALYIRVRRVRHPRDLVLTDDDLGTIEAAIEEGRRIYTNIRTFLRYALSGGLAEVLVMLIGPLLGFAVPLLPGQILWINMLTHGLPGVAIGAEPADPETMQQPPRSPQEQILGAGLWKRIALTGPHPTRAGAGSSGPLGAGTSALPGERDRVCADGVRGRSRP